MARTIISLPDDDKRWLDAYSHATHQSLAKTVRLAIKFYRQQQKAGVKKDALSMTSGLWQARKIDALGYVQKMRKEWDGRA